MFNKVKEFASNHKGAVTALGTTAMTTLAACPVFAAGETGYLDSSVFNGISANILADINTNILPNAWPIFGVVLAVGIGMKLFQKVC